MERVVLISCALLLSACGEPATCDPVCAPWQACDESGECLTSPGHCATSVDCPEDCDPISHLCVAGACEPSCADWQVCKQSACEAAAGRCGSDNDCSDSTPVCNLDDHLCEAATCAAGCEGWQECDGTVCVNPLIGDALINGRNNFTYPDGMSFPSIGWVSTVDEDAWRWTHKSAVYFGDPMIPLWTDAAQVAAPAINVSKVSASGGATLTFTFSPAATGTLSFATAASLYQIGVDQSASVEVSIAEDPSELNAGFSSGDTLSAFLSQSW